MGNGFWYNLRNMDNITHKAALKYQRYLIIDGIRWKNVPTRNKRYQTAFYRRLLSHEIKEILQKRKDLNKELSNYLGILNNCTTWMKMQIIKYSNCYINKQTTKVNER